MGSTIEPEELTSREATSPDYYVLCDSEPPNPAIISHQPVLPIGSDNWRTGQFVAMHVDQPLIYEIDREEEGTLSDYFSDLDAPLMSSSLVKVLLDCGIDNLELFDAIIRETHAGKDYHNYKAVNVIGLVRCADMEQSVHSASESPADDEPLLSVWFESLVIDKKRAGGRLLFRLAEDVSLILVHRKVRECIEATIRDEPLHIRFQDPASLHSLTEEDLTIDD